MRKNNITVEMMVSSVIYRNKPFYPENFIDLVPQELLEQKISNFNKHRLIGEVNKIRIQKEQELAKLLGLDTSAEQKAKLKKILQSNDHDLTEQQEDIKRQARFLYNVAARIRG